MVNYVCNKCNKNFNQKCHYLVHINKKFDCSQFNKVNTEPLKTLPEPLNITKNINQNIDKENENNLCCNYCGLEFNRKDNLKRHIEKVCKVKKLQDEEEKDKENIFKILLAKEEEEKKQLKESNKKLEDYVKKLTDMNIELNNKVGKLLEKMSVNNITNNITTNNNIINISKDKLVNFGEEDVKDIELKLFSNCFNKFGKHIFEASAKNIWFNKSKNKNFYISDLSRDKAMTYKNGQFYLTPINTVLTTINQQLYKYFKHNIEEIKKTNNKKLMEKVEKEIMQAYKMFFNAFDDKVDKFQPDSDRMAEYSKVVNTHLTKFFNSVKKDIISNYEQIKNDVLNDNILKQIEYEPAIKKRGRPKKNIEDTDIKTTSIPKNVSGKNEIKNMLKELKEEIKDIKTVKVKVDEKENKKKDKKDKEEIKDAAFVIKRKGKTYYIDESESDLESLF